MLPADPRIVFQVTGAVLGALILWVIFVNVRLPTRAVTGVVLAMKTAPPAEADEGEKSDEDDEDDEGEK